MRVAIATTSTSGAQRLSLRSHGRRPIVAVAALSPLPKHSHLPQRRHEEEAGHFTAPSPKPSRQVSGEGPVMTEAYAATLAVPDVEAIRAEEQQARQAAEPRGEFVPDDVIKEFEAKLQGDIQSVVATLIAGIGVITWWRGVWALLDHFIGDSVFGDCMCVITGLFIILYLRFSGAKLTNFFPPS